jgi:hypothetical protein
MGRRWVNEGWGWARGRPVPPAARSPGGTPRQGANWRSRLHSVEARVDVVHPPADLRARCSRSWGPRSPPEASCAAAVAQARPPRRRSSRPATNVIVHQTPTELRERMVAQVASEPAGIPAARLAGPATRWHACAAMAGGRRGMGESGTAARHRRCGRGTGDPQGYRPRAGAGGCFRRSVDVRRGEPSRWHPWRPPECRSRGALPGGCPALVQCGYSAPEPAVDLVRIVLAGIARLAGLPDE